MRLLIVLCLMIASLTVMARGVEPQHMDRTPEQVLAGADQRVEAMFRAEAGHPLVRAKKQPPLAKGRGNYVRAYSYSIMAFAARCFYLNEMVDEANAALVENARHYMDNPKDINDRDSFHWHAEIVARFIEMYGVNGGTHAGLLTEQTEQEVLKPLFEYAKQFSTPERQEHQQSQTWHVYESENHHAMGFTVCWHFARLARNRPEYRDLRYNGATAAEHYKAWNEYFIAYCRERAKKGMFIEMMSAGYNSTLLKGVYNFYDFGEPEVRRSAGMLLDLYFAYWAQEQIDGIAGGGQSRVYFPKGLEGRRRPLEWYYFGIGKPPEVDGHDVNAALSDYRPPAVVADIALDVRGRGRYEVRQRPQGLGTTGNRNPYRMRTDGGGILRYTFCDPAFILGTPMTLALPDADWAAISSQNRWQGAVFAGHPNARIVPAVRPKDDRTTYNAFWSVQHKGTLVTQRTRFDGPSGPMIVYISQEGLGEPVEEEGVVFVEAQGAYAAIRVAGGDYTWLPEADSVKDAPAHKVLVPKDMYAPVILEVMSKNDIASFDAFKAKVKQCAIKMEGSVLSYASVYGDVLTLDTSYKQTPTINGTPVDYAPKKAFDSPFLNSEYDSGVVMISKGERKVVLDFNKPTADAGSRTIGPDASMTRNVEEGDRTHFNPRGAQAMASLIVPNLVNVAPLLGACLVQADPSLGKSIENPEDHKAFDKANDVPWKQVLSDPCTGDWKEKWFLDGQVGQVSTGPEGMTLTAGSEFKNDAHHMVLWTRQEFQGDLKIEYDYTRLDNENRCVTILYIQATGSGRDPYAKDITRWNDLRKVPAMKSYFDNMNLYHISYAAEPGKDGKSYIRARRYMPHASGLKNTDLAPDYWPVGLFKTGVKHHITVIKRERDLHIRVENPQQVYYCHMANPDLPPITEGRIGLRHMFTRSARYENFVVSAPQEK